MVSVQELVKKIAKRDATIKDLREKIGNLSESMQEAYLNFAILLGSEIGKSHQIEPQNLEIYILLDGKIVIKSGETFKLKFDNYNRCLEYLLCMVRLIGIENGSAVAMGRKTQAEIYFAHDDCYKQGKKGVLTHCVSCGKKLPKLDPDDPVILEVCEECYQNGET